MHGPRCTWCRACSAPLAAISNIYNLSVQPNAESTLHLVLRLRGGAGPGALTKYVAQALGKPSFREAWAAGGWKMVGVFSRTLCFIGT